MTLERDARPGLGGIGRAATAALAGDHQELFYNGRGVVCGRLQGGWLRKSADSTKHQLRQPPAWALDRQDLKQLREVGARGVLLTDEMGRQWKATVGAFDAHGIAFDRGHGQQVALPLSFWQVWTPGAPEQLQMFGEVGNGRRRANQ